MAAFKIPTPCNILLVNAEVIGPHGSHLVRMILDTGATYTMIHPDALVKIGCEPLSLEKRRIVTASGVEFVSFTPLPEIRVLGQTFHDLEICVHDLPQSLPAEGLLGLNFLRHFNIHLNFLNGYLEITQ
jgi:predicted aspartyl protease